MILTMERYILFVTLTGDISKKAFAQFRERLRGAEMYEFPVDEQLFNALFTKFESEQFEDAKDTMEEQFQDFRKINAAKRAAAKEKKELEKSVAAKCYQGKRP